MGGGNVHCDARQCIQHGSCLADETKRRAMISQVKQNGLQCAVQWYAIQQQCIGSELDLPQRREESKGMALEFNTPSLDRNGLQAIKVVKGMVLETNERVLQQGRRDGATVLGVVRKRTLVVRGTRGGWRRWRFGWLCCVDGRQYYADGYIGQ